MAKTPTTNPTPAAPEAPAALEVISNNTLEIVDNTEAAEVAVVEVATEEVPLLGDLVQVNYL